MLLIGDQEAASEEFKKMGREIAASRAKYSSGNYLRYFPSMVDDKGGRGRQRDTETPKERGFPVAE